ncbi:MAG: hypothetical protein GXP45_08165 [bacterium]|nr:hypothetical protein [bacterium]
MFQKILFSNNPTYYQTSQTREEKPRRTKGINTLNEKYQEIPNQEMQIIQKGQAQGKLIGGNSTSFLHLTGTNFFPSLKNKIIFLEDTLNTPLNTRDRMLHHLSLQKHAKEIKGILLGKTGTDHHITSEQRKQLFQNIPIRKDIPIIANLDIGHGEPIITFPIGLQCNIDTQQKKIKF